MTKVTTIQFQKKYEALKARNQKLKENLDAKLQNLIESRRKKILKIVEKAGAIQVDDILLTGALLFLKDEKNKDDPILKTFLEYANPKKKQKTSKNTTTA